MKEICLTDERVLAERDAFNETEKPYPVTDIVSLFRRADQYPDRTAVVFKGRNDGQVKLRGFRIELTEVESVIREYPGITDATVQAFENGKNGGKYIAAYVVSGSPVAEASLKEFVRQRKPAYMVPSVVMQIDAIPLNQNQKVNRRTICWTGLTGTAWKTSLICAWIPGAG